jgi:hypothetical protein
MTAWVRLNRWKQVLLVLVVANLAYVLVVAIALSVIPVHREFYEPALIWTGTFWVGTVFSFWATLDTWLDRKAMEGQTALLLYGARWQFRSELLDLFVCLTLLSTGVVTILQVGWLELRVALLFFGGVLMVARRILDRAGRIDLEHTV